MDGLFIVTPVVAPHRKFPRWHEHHRSAIFTGDLLLLRLRRACGPSDKRNGHQQPEHTPPRLPPLPHPHTSTPFRLATGQLIVNLRAVILNTASFPQLVPSVTQSSEHMAGLHAGLRAKVLQPFRREDRFTRSSTRRDECRA
jgi:hypothetical protein